MRRPLLQRGLSAIVLLGVLAWLSASWSTTAAGQEFLARPEIPGHATPTAEFPQPRQSGWEYVDVAALFAALSLASYLALVRRWRRGLLGLTIVSVIWFGFWRKGCVCSIGAIQNVSLALGDPSVGVSVSVVAFFALPLLFTLFFGRTFCGSVCPLGAVQELVTLRPVKTPWWLDQALGLLAYVYLGAAVLFAASGTAFVICEYDPFVGFFRRTAGLNMLIVGGCFLVIGLFVGRPYCRYLCPYGVVLRWLSKVSRWHLRIPGGECVKCALCEDCCPYGAIREPTVNQSPEQRTLGRWRLIALAVLAPGLIGGGALLGRGLAVPLSRMDADVQLAERLRREETGQVEDTTDGSEAFRNSGRPIEELYSDAIGLQHRFAWLGGWLGAWVGLVIGGKLIQLSLRRRRTDYQPDRSGCVSCGRCFWYCPIE